MAIDMTGLMREKLPLGYFSNAVCFSLIEAPGRNKNDRELWRITKLVHDGVLGIQEGEIRSASERLRSGREDGGATFELPVETYGPELTIASMEHMTISVMLASVEAPLLNARCSLMSKVVDATKEFDGPLKTNLMGH